MPTSELSPYRYAIDWRAAVPGTVYRRDEARLHAALGREDYVHAYPPPLLTRAYLEHTYAAGRAVRAGVADVFERRFDSSVEQVGRFLGFEQRHIDLFHAIASDRTLEMAMAFARPDFNVTAQGIRLVECNFATSLGGINTIDPYNAALLGSDLFTDLPPDVSVDWLQPSWAKTIEHFSRERSVSRRGPARIFYALASHDDTNRGFPKFRELASRSGYIAFAGRLDDLDLSARGATFSGLEMDVILSGFTWSECKQHVSFRQIEKLVSLDRLGVLSYIAPPLYAIFDSKLLLALIDPDHMARMGFADTVPPTVPVTMDHVDRIFETPKDDWVLKPAGEYGGKGIVVGATVADAAWRTMVVDIAGTEPASGANFVAQQVVRPAIFESPSPGSGLALSLGPLLFGENNAGMLARQGVVDSSSGGVPILNQKRGAMGSSVVRAPA